VQYISGQGASGLAHRSGLQFLGSGASALRGGELKQTGSGRDTLSYNMERGEQRNKGGNEETREQYDGDDGV
jgi:hypothetical protein